MFIRIFQNFVNIDCHGELAFDFLNFVEYKHINWK